MADFKQNYFQRRTKDRGPRSNNRISSPDVQVIASDGENLGVLNTNEAISMAKNQGLDLIENYAGKFPFWISPLQTMVIPISEEFNDYAVKISKKIKDVGISSAVDLKNNNLNYKIRDHSLAKIPLLLICGKKEVDSNSVTIRRLDSNKQENMGIEQFLKTFSALNKASSN